MMKRIAIGQTILAAATSCLFAMEYDYAGIFWAVNSTVWIWLFHFYNKER